MIKHNITASHFYNYQTCPRSIYLDIFGDLEKKLPLTEFQKHLFEQGRDFEKDVISDLGLQSIEKFFSSPEEAFTETLKQMQNGEAFIYQGTLLHGKFLGIPDILEKVEGTSKFGNYYYRPVDIKMGKRAEEKYKLQVCFYAFLLGKIQEHFPEQGGLILHDKNKEYFPTNELMPKFQENLKNIEALVAGKEEPIHISSRCNDCQWRSFCKEIALEKDDISLIYKLQKRVKDNLKAAGINTVKDMAEVPLEKLLSTKYIGKKTAERLQLQARSLIENKVIKIGTPTFRQRPIEIYFDIEGETRLGVEYLFGLLICQNGQTEYKSFIAEKPEDEEQLWQDFLNYIDTLENYVMYHYHSYETTVLNRFTEKYKTNKDSLYKLLTHMVDLRTIISNNLIFPIYKYSIKDIAKYLGFSWSNKDANAAQSMLWYSLWLSTGDRKYLELSIEYNQDDCKATKHVKDWVEKFFKTT